MNTTATTTGRRLRELRRNRRKTQDALTATLRAFNIPITRDILANWETNRVDIPARFIPILAYELAAEVTDLLPDLDRRQVNELAAGRMGLDLRAKGNGCDRNAVRSAPKASLHKPRGRRARAGAN